MKKQTITRLLFLLRNSKSQRQTEAIKITLNAYQNHDQTDNHNAA